MGRGHSAVQLHKAMRRFFKWCAGTEGYGATGLENNPMASMHGKPVDVERGKRPSRALKPHTEIIWLFRALYRLGGRQADAIEFLLRSMNRRNENFCATWAWDRGDRLCIPKTKAVGRNAVSYPLDLPLAPSMRALIGDRPEDARGDDPIWGFGPDWLAKHFIRLRKLMTEEAIKDGFNGTFTCEFLDEARTERNLDYWTGHDFRDTGKAILKGIRRDDGLKKFNSDVWEAMLNHRESGIAKTYGADVGDADYLYLERTIAGLDLNAKYDNLKNEALKVFEDPALAA
jgi:hypothetical protein